MEWWWKRGHPGKTTYRTQVTGNFEFMDFGCGQRHSVSKAMVTGNSGKPPGSISKGRRIPNTKL